MVGLFWYYLGVVEGYKGFGRGGELEALDLEGIGFGWMVYVVVLLKSRVWIVRERRRGLRIEFWNR